MRSHCANKLGTCHCKALAHLYEMPPSHRDLMSQSEEAMHVALATAYHDANDRMFDQIARVLPVISSLFPHIAVQASSMAPQRSLHLLQQAGAAIEQASAAEPTGAAQLGNVRRLALNLALRSQASVVIYFDFDSLLHWIETYPDEL